MHALSVVPAPGAWLRVAEVPLCQALALQPESNWGLAAGQTSGEADSTGSPADGLSGGCGKRRGRVHPCGFATWDGGALSEWRKAEMLSEVL